MTACCKITPSQARLRWLDVWQNLEITCQSITAWSMRPATRSTKDLGMPRHEAIGRHEANANVNSRGGAES